MENKFNHINQVICIILLIILPQSILFFNMNANGNLTYYIPYAIICFVMWIFVSKDTFNDNYKDKIYKYGIFILLLIVQYLIVKKQDTFFIVYFNIPLQLILYKILPQIQNKKSKLLKFILIYFVILIAVSTIAVSLYDNYCIKENERPIEFNTNPILTGCRITNILSLIGIIVLHAFFIFKVYVPSQINIKKLIMISVIIIVIGVNLYRVIIINHNFKVYENFSQITHNQNYLNDFSSLCNALDECYNDFLKYGINENKLFSNSIMGYKKINAEIASIVNQGSIKDQDEKYYNKNKNNFIKMFKYLDEHASNSFIKIQEINRNLIIFLCVENCIFILVIMYLNKKVKNAKY